LAAELLVAIGDCQQWVDPWFKFHRGYNPLWSPRPPEGLTVEHLWEVVVHGLPEGEGVELRNRAGDVVVSAVSRGIQVPLHASTVITPTDADRELTIIRAEREGERFDGARRDDEVPEGETPGRGLEVRQTNLVVDGEIPLPQSCRRLALADLLGGPVVVALLDDRAIAYDLRTAAAAAPVASWEGDFSGAVRLPQGTLLYGADGASLVDARGRMTPTEIREPVLDGARQSDGVVLVTEGRVVEMSYRLRLVTDTARPEVTSVGRLSGVTVLGHRYGLEVRGGRGRAPLARGRVMSLRDASSLRRGALLATWDNQSASLIGTADGDIVELAHYRTSPERAMGVLLSDRFVRLVGNGTRIRLFQTGQSVRI
jgi:hypothetical protein